MITLARFTDQSPTSLDWIYEYLKHWNMFFINCETCYKPLLIDDQLNFDYMLFVF